MLVFRYWKHRNTYNSKTLSFPGWSILYPCVGLQLSCNLYSQCKRWISIRLGHEKRKPCFTGATDANFLFGRKLLFFKNFFQNLVKSAVFWPRSETFGWIFFENKSKYFPKFFCQKYQRFLEIFVFLGSFLGTINKKIN